MMRPMRVLHVVGRMNRGGAETWLLQVARSMVGGDVRFDFLVHNPEPGAYDEELRSLGCRLIPCPIDSAIGYTRRLSRVLTNLGPFDVVHSHVHHFSGLVLAVAKRHRVPVRIAHSHAAADSATTSPVRRMYLAVTEALVRHSATAGLAVSGGAATSLFGKHWRRDSRWRIQYCSIDVARYRTSTSRSAVRAALALNPGSLVVGHVGRFDRQKNHRYLLDVFAAVRTLRPDAHLLLVGDGPLRPEIQRVASARGLAEFVSFLGSRGDVAELMASAMDVLVMPSLFEGLPLVALEAQATGLPMVLADTITTELEVIPELVRWHSLQDGPDTWAASIVAQGAAPRLPHDDAIRRMLAGPFSIDAGIAALRQVYGLPVWQRSVGRES